MSTKVEYLIFLINAFLGMSPLVVMISGYYNSGWIKDNASTAVTLHCLNIFTWLTALSWGLEKYITSRRQKAAELEIVKA